MGGGSEPRANKSASTPLPHRRPLGVDGNVCCLVFQIGSLVFSPFLRSGEISFSVCRWRSWLFATTLTAGARWFSWSEDAGPEVVDLPFLSNFVDGRRQILVQDSTGTSPGRRATATRALLRAAGLLINSQSLVGDGVFSDLAMVEARRLFRRSPRRRWSWATAAGYGGCRKS